MELPIVNHQDYEAKLNDDNKFPIKKFGELAKLLIKNTISGAFSDLTESFQKQTFISKIKIYDEDMNCIGIAKSSTPIPKKVSRDLTFKLKIDI